MITRIIKRVVNGKSLNHVVAATFRLRLRRLKPAATMLLALWCFGALAWPSFAQTERGRILSTSEQQYVNLVKNGSLEAFSAGASLAPDGFASAGLNAGAGSVARDATNKFQSYSVKLTQTNATGAYILRYDTAITGFGASLTGESADLTATEWQKIALYSNNGYVASAWVKLPGGASNPASVTIKSDADQKVYVEIVSNANNDYCYIDGLQVTEGPSALSFTNNPILDTGDQQVFGDIRVQDNDSTNYIILDKDTGSVTMSGTLTATATNADTLDAIDSIQFLRSDVSDAVTTGATLNVDSGAVLSIDGAWDIGGTQVTPTAAELNILSGGLSAAELDATLLTATEGGTAYVDVGGDTMTGALNLPANGLIAGTNQLVLANGNVGIGTAAPNYKLEVNGITNFRDTINIWDGNAGTVTWSAGILSMYAASGRRFDLGANGTTPFMTIVGAGNVGIGTTNPAAKLQISGNPANIMLYNTSSNDTAQITETTSGHLQIIPQTYRHLIVNTTENDEYIVDFQSAGASKVVIDYNGSVGINTTSPEAKLDVQGPMRVSSAGDVGISHDLYFEDTTASNINSYGPLTIQSGNPNSNYNLVLKGTGTGKVIVDDDFSATGNIELGDASADTVSIHGTVIGASPALFVNQSSADDIVVVQDSGTNVFKILDGGNSYFMGNLGIGTTAPTAPLHIRGPGTNNQTFMISEGSNGTDSVKLGTGGSGDGTLTLLSSGGDNRVLLQGYGNSYFTGGSVGIGLTGPGEELSVAGNVMIGDATWAGGTTTGNLAVQGNVGIGTTGPGQKLDIQGGNVIIGSPASEGDVIRNLQFQRNGNVRGVISTTNDELMIRGNAINFNTVDDSSPNIRMYITAGGNVGIGTTGPARPLAVGTGTPNRSIGSPGAYITGGIEIDGDSWFDGQVDFNGLIQKHNGQLRMTQGVDLTFGNADAYRIQYDNVSALWKLYDGVNTFLSIKDQGTTADIAFNGTGLFIQNTGNVGIGTTAPGSRLEAVGMLSTATGNETAYKLAYTTNKATSGNDTGLLIAMTDTLSPGTSSLIDAQVGGVSKFNVDNAGNITSVGTINNQTIGAASSLASLNLSGDLTVGGNFTVNGTETILNVETVEVESNTIKMNRNITGAPSLNASMVIERGTSPDTAIRWNETNDVWDLTNDGTNYHTMLHSNTSFGGDVSGTASTIAVANDSHAHTSTTLPANTSYLDSTIGTTELEDSSVTSIKIADATIASSDLAAGSVIKSKLNELRPHEVSTPNNTVYVESGIVSIANNAKINFTASSSPVFPVVTANSRIDLLTIDAAGALARVTGAEAVSPTAPTYPNDKLVIAEVLVNETTTVTINDSDITDVRPFLNLGGGSGTSSIVSTEADTFEIDSDDSSAAPTLTFGANASASPQIITQVGPLTLNPAGTNNIVMAPDGGNVGIGTSGPGATLDVKASTTGYLVSLNNTYSTPNYQNAATLYVTNNNSDYPGILTNRGIKSVAGYINMIDNDGNNTWLSAGSGGVVVGTNGGANTSLTVQGPTVGTQTGYLQQWKTAAAGTTLGVFTLSGNLGIGTTAPSAKLYIDSTDDSSSLYVYDNDSNPTTQQVKIQRINNVASASSANAMVWLNDHSSNMPLYITNQNNLDILAVYGSGKVVINTGNVGIGTTNPGAPLTVNTTISKAVNITGVTSADYDFGYWINGQAAITSDETTSWLRLNQNNSWTNGVYTPGSIAADGTLIAPKLNVGYNYTVNGGTNNAIISGNVGIGTTGPTSKLHLVGSSTPDTVPASYFAASTDLSLSSGHQYVGHRFDLTTTAPGNANQESITARYNNYYTSTSSKPNGKIIGFYASPNINSTGVVTVGEVDANVSQINAYGSANVITNAYYYNTVAPYLANGGTISNLYGFYIPNGWAVGTSSNYGIYIGDSSAKNYFSGNVGIGTTDPGSYNLNVNGTINAATIYEGAASLVSKYVQLQAPTPGTQQTGSLNISGTGLFGGNVGIGTTGPEQKLDISVSGNVANAQFRGTGSRLLINTYQSYAQIYTDGSNLNLMSSSGGNVAIGSTNFGSRLVVRGTTSDSTASALNITDSNSGSMLFVRNDGNVGIGTTNPAAKLDVGGNIYPSASGSYDLGLDGKRWNNVYVNTLQLFGTPHLIPNGGQLTTSATTFNMGYNVGSGDNIIKAMYSYPMNLKLQTFGVGSIFLDSQGTGAVILNPTQGNVGIGTAVPTAKLDVTGGDIAAQTAKKIIMDSNDEGDSYMIHDSTNNRVSIFVDGIEMVRINK